ncbi:MAG: DUF2867 domain-containing protein [Kiloniellales bacterium]|nr:DUF2867 domain-containing protein [Kiloniellales bacterium]
MGAVTRSALAAESGLHAFCAPGDFLDCYSVEIGRAGVPVAEIAQRIFLGLPAWINALLALRDLAVIPFGLKTTLALPKDRSIRPAVAVGEVINFFRVRSLAEDEIILGEDDRHLDFKIAVRRDGAAGRRISLATWVHPHNRLGRAYLRLILPFHVRIVTARLAALARDLAA